MTVLLRWLYYKGDRNARFYHTSTRYFNSFKVCVSELYYVTCQLMTLASDMEDDTGKCACWFCCSHLLCPSLPRRTNCSLYRSVRWLRSSQTPAVCTSSSAPARSPTPWWQKAATRHQNMTTDPVTLHIQVLSNYAIHTSAVINLWSHDSYLCSRTSCVLCVSACWWLMCVFAAVRYLSLQIYHTAKMFSRFFI